ncbi:Uncharacterised protein [Yersinia wautersii]|uniref:Uncharacterized protein n=2 Tax=Yersinia TaxID=629 RepID=A0ABM9TKN2_9GAMM|nr:Uncharacterised protein [Yersinia wautersii]
MDKIEYLLAAIGLLFTIFMGIAKFNRDGRKDRDQTYINFSAAMDKDNPDKYLVEKLFPDITKCYNTTYHEIYYLMKSSNPTQTTSEFSLIRKNWKIFTITESGFAIYSDNYNSSKKRYLKSIINIILFILIYGLSIAAPVLIGTVAEKWILVNIPSENHSVIIMMAAFFIVLISVFLVWICMRLISYTSAIFKSNKFIEKFNSI